VKVHALRSIGTRLMVATTLLVALVAGSVVWLWATADRDLYYDQKRREAESLATGLAGAWVNELEEQNWSQIRANAERIAETNDDVAYVIVTDDRLGGQVVAAVPADIIDRYVPDVVPLPVTQAALAPSPGARASETFLLRPVALPGGRPRAARGQRIIEVAADVRNFSGFRAGTLRVGISLAAVDRAVASAVKKTLLVGVLCLLVGLAGAWLLARRLTHPIDALRASAAKIASGDLEHRARVHRVDEVGLLAASFNDMTAALEASFEKLEGTLASFERFVPEKFLAAIAPEGIERIKVGAAVEKRVSILFSDIRGYTSISEGQTPLEVFRFLNIYFERMGEAIRDAGGFIDKYIGDAIMALFDDPASDGALAAALAMRGALARLNEERARAGRPPLDMGVGIHAGDVVVGTVGSPSRMSPTAIGDAVNVASRVEGLTKQYGCAILVTESVVAAVARPDAFSIRLVATGVKVKGKDEPVALYEVRAAGEG